MAQNIVNYADNPTGPELLDNYLAKEQENILSSNSGIQRPSYASAGTAWIDTSVTPWLYKIYDGSEDVVFGSINPTTHSFIASGINETNLVHKTGNETISGNKTFSGYGNFTNFNAFWKTPYNIIVRSTSIENGVTPSSNQYMGIEFRDKNDVRVGWIGLTKKTDGTQQIELQKQGSTSGFAAPTPSVGDNSNLIATTEFVQTALSNTVHKTGNETINGEKTFKDAVFTNIGFNKTFNITRGTAPSIVLQGEIAIGKDINGLGLGNFYYYHGTDNSNNVGIYCYDPTKSEGYTNASIQVGYNENGGVFTTAPACDNGNSIVTTVAKSRGLNGFYKLGNGLIIQWGYNASTNSGRTITFPTPFYNAYGLSIIKCEQTNSGGDYTCASGSETLTNFKVFVNTHIRWIAIGY